MSPPVAAIVPGAAKDYKAESTLARLLGSGMPFNHDSSSVEASPDNP